METEVGLGLGFWFCFMDLGFREFVFSQSRVKIDSLTLDDLFFDSRFKTRGFRLPSSNQVPCDLATTQ